MDDPVPSLLAAAQPADEPWLWSTAYAIPKHTTNQGSGYFSIIEGHNGRLYIGTAKYGENSYLVEFGRGVDGRDGGENAAGELPPGGMRRRASTARSP